MRRCWLFCIVATPKAIEAGYWSGQYLRETGSIWMLCAGGDFDQAEIARLLVDSGALLAPPVEQLHIDGASVAVTALLQFADQVSAGKSTGAGDHHRIAS